MKNNENYEREQILFDKTFVACHIILKGPKSIYKGETTCSSIRSMHLVIVVQF